MDSTSLDIRIFRCIKCDHVDHIESALAAATLEGVEYHPLTCTKCLTGNWHGYFPYLLYDPLVDRVVNPNLPV